MYLNSFSKAFLILFFITFSLNASASLIQVSATYESGATLDFSYNGQFGVVSSDSKIESLSFTCPECVNNESLASLINFDGYVIANDSSDVSFEFSFDDIATTLLVGDGVFSAYVSQGILVLSKSLGPQVGFFTWTEISQVSVSLINRVPLPATSILFVSGLLLVGLKRRNSALGEKSINSCVHAKNV